MPGTRVELTLRAASASTPSPRARSPTRRAATLILYEDSYGSLALAVSQRSAAQLLRVEEGAEIVLDLAVR